jgi:hypothetical protein
MKRKESGQKDASSFCKSNCQNGKSKTSRQQRQRKMQLELANHIAKMENCQLKQKNEDQEKHYLFANSIVQMTNPN